MDASIRHPKTSLRPIVAFDFDGTLTCRDSFVGFLRWRVGSSNFAAGLLALAPDILGYIAAPDRGRLKAAMAKRFIGRIDKASLAAEADRFHRARFDDLMRPDALDCWRDWRARNARLLIVTASPEILVAPFARALGADGLLGTRLAFDAEGRFTGALAGPNCRGPEKVARLGDWLGQAPRLTAAYGDSDGDRDMLGIADAGHMKFFRRRP